MAKKFRKQMLSIGTYRSPDGEMKVTRDRLANWSKQFKRMTDAGQVIPMHWDHSSNLEELTPVAMDLYERKERSAKNAIGRMSGFDVASDGNSATVSFETRDPDAERKFANNVVKVSPVFFSNWADGAGNLYSDCITHLDAVVHPVDHSQSDAEEVVDDVVCCAIRFGVNSKPFEKESDEGEEGDEGQEEDEETEEADVNTSATVSSVVEQLAKVGIVLPEDTTGTNFIDRINVALLTAIASQGIEEMPDPNKPAEEKTVVDPQIATMSLQAKQALAFGERTHRAAVKTELDALLNSGRCTPAEHKDRASQVGVIKLSLDDKGEPLQSSLEAWIDSRKEVPQGTFWSSEQRLTRMSVADHPGPVDFNASGEQVDADKAADFVLGKS
ncbi:hypothetical protein Pla52o_35160 [Novipirellula galeiformis]|uniref:Uncharacterized protein n=1 Tax=Novipirellula galeiformis TaxID=2528004 RepID=A0A5C6CD27_9BACT|nr:hypothetical protein [Novipirellula galeiformis]TWU22460.1 hypothetical protein Pla52o_35160 [Novipirellula galeiformis]